MCLGVPARVVRILDETRSLAMVEVLGVERETNMMCVAPDDAPLETLVGSFVLLHVGFAMSVIDEAEARRTLEVLDALGEMEAELAAIRSGARA